MIISPVLLFSDLLAWKGRDLSVRSLVSSLFAIALYSSSIYWKIGGAARFLWFVSLLGPLMVVGVAAAVNSGLSK